MDLSTILTILSILAIIGAASTILIKWISKKVSTIASEVIQTQEKSCAIVRGNEMSCIIERIEKLEHSDTETQITIAKLIIHHETTQAMIQKIEDHQQRSFTKLIETIQSMSKHS